MVVVVEVESVQQGKTDRQGETSFQTMHHKTKVWGNSPGSTVLSISASAG